MTRLVKDIRNAAIEECAALAQRWANDASQFEDERSRVMSNVCRNMAVALRNLKE